MLKAFLSTFFWIVTAVSLSAGQSQNEIPTWVISLKQTVARPPEASGWGPTGLIVPFSDLESVLKNETIWSLETNQIKAGILVQYPSGRRTNAALYTVIGFNPGTNSVKQFLGLSLPRLGLRYQYALTDSKGNSIPKTKWGNQFAGVLQSGISRMAFGKKFGPDGIPLVARMTVFDKPIILSDLFNIPKGGHYRLDVEVRLANMSGKTVQVYYFPVKVDLEFDESLPTTDGNQ